MNRVRATIVLQLKDMAGIWSTEGIFNSLTEAVEHGRRNFLQNEWQIVGVTERDQRMLYEHEPLEGMQVDAAADVQRFRDVVHYREVFARLSQVEANHEQTRAALANIARHRVHEQRLYEDEFAWSFADKVPARANWMVEGF